MKAKLPGAPLSRREGTVDDGGAGKTTRRCPAPRPVRLTLVVEGDKANDGSSKTESDKELVQILGVVERGVAV